MKKKLLCLILAAAAALQLGACSMLEKEYVSIHDYMPSEQEPNVTGSRLTVHSASALKLALLSMAYEGRTEGTIIFDSSYEGDAAEDLENACWAVRTEDALCAYCVENISYDFNKIITINEADIRISYSKVSASPKQIVHLGFSSEAETAILNAMAEDMAAQVNKTYRDNPTVVPKKPQAIVNVFSGAGTQRLYEIQIDYGVTALELARCRKQLELFRPFAELDRPNASEVERAYVACRYLVENCRILDDDSTEEANSAYTALIERRADSEGLAFGYMELCRQLDVDCRIVYGQHDWQEHCWNIVRIDDSYYHVDITQCAKGGPALGFMQNDETFWTMYRWDVAAYPKCTGTNSFFDFFPPSMIDSLSTGSESTAGKG